MVELMKCPEMGCAFSFFVSDPLNFLWLKKSLTLLQSGWCIQTYLKVIYAFEVLHASPHDPEFVWHHLPILVKDANHIWLFHKPKGILERTASLSKEAAFLII